MLRAKYPATRIAVRDPLADLERVTVWYCLRDGKVVPTSDGLGAARIWSPIERETRRSVDLLEWSSQAMRRSRQLMDAASESMRRSKVST